MYSDARFDWIKSVETGKTTVPIKMSERGRRQLQVVVYRYYKILIEPSLATRFP